MPVSRPGHNQNTKNCYRFANKSINKLVAFPLLVSSGFNKNAIS